MQRENEEESWDKRAFRPTAASSRSNRRVRLPLKPQVVRPVRCYEMNAPSSNIYYNGQRVYHAGPARSFSDMNACGCTHVCGDPMCDYRCLTYPYYVRGGYLNYQYVNMGAYQEQAPQIYYSYVPYGAVHPRVYTHQGYPVAGGAGSYRSAPYVPCTHGGYARPGSAFRPYVPRNDQGYYAAAPVYDPNSDVQPEGRANADWVPPCTCPTRPVPPEANNRHANLREGFRTNQPQPAAAGNGGQPQEEDQAYSN